MVVANERKLRRKFIHKRSKPAKFTTNQFCATGAGGGVDPSCSPGSSSGSSSRGRPSATVIERLQRLGVKAKELEHAVVSYTTDKVKENVAKLPKPMRKAVEATYYAARVGTKAAFVGWSASQALAEKVAIERGLNPEQARKLRGTLSTLDLVAFKPMSIALPALGAGAIGSAVSWVVPPITGAYLAYSAARNPLLSMRAATKLVREKLGLPQQPTRKPPPGPKYRPQILELERNADLALENAGLVEDALRAWNYEDDAIALFHAALEETYDVRKAIDLVNEIRAEGKGALAIKYPKIRNPFKYDPSRTVTIRRKWIEDLRRRFSKIKLAMAQLVWHDDAFGLDDTPLLQRNSLTENAGQWAFHSDPEKVRLFQEWIKRKLKEELTGKTADEVWGKYVQRAFEQGAGRAFDDVKGAQRWEPGKGAFYRGSKEQFMRSSFGRPESIEKVKLLAGRTFTDLDGISESMSRRMSRILVDGLARGQNPRETARDMSRALDIDLRRAEVIARTETIAAHAEGQLQAFEALGLEEVGVAVEWSTAGDERVCQHCEPLEGVVLKISEAHNKIPLHPQCRCAFRPANVGEDTEGQVRSKRAIEAAIKESNLEPPGEWDISKDRPKGTIQNTYHPTDEELALNVFCATGSGGGVDPTCSPGESAGGGSEGASDSDSAKTTPCGDDCFEPDVYHDSNRDGITDAARVGVKAFDVPPPPSIGRLPNLTEHERAVEKAFIEHYENAPEQVANDFRDEIRNIAEKKGDVPTFGTDDAKILTKAWSHPDQETRAENRATLNLALHQTANAIAKRAFLQELDTLKEGDQILVTVGGCGAGKGYALKNVQQALEMKQGAKVVWDSAGDQNATENPWIQSEAERRGLKVNYVFVHADPYSQWADPKKGVVKRAADPSDGRMVDAKVFADSYAVGAKNHQAFYEKNRSNPNAKFVFLDNRDKPTLMAKIPDDALKIDSKHLADYALDVVKKSDAPDRVKRGATAGERIWQK